jgi:hypothetical protein
LKDRCQVQAQVDQVDRRSAGVQRDGLAGQTEDHGLGEAQQCGVGRQAERHREHDGDLDADRASRRGDEVVGRLGHRSHGSAARSGA